MSVSAVFFDLDGTLIDTAPDMGGALNRLLVKHNLPTVTEQAYRPYVSHGSLALLKLGFPETTPSDELHLLRTDFLSDYENNISLDSRLFQQVETVLTTLQAQSIPWGIITNKPEYLTLSLLDDLNLRNRCCCIIGADTAARAKPHPEPMLLACKLSGVKPQDCIYVGDAERDIQAGRSVGMKSLIAGWGYIHPIDDIPEQWGADGWLQEPQELLQHLPTQ